MTQITSNRGADHQIGFRFFQSDGTTAELTPSNQGRT